MRIDSEQSFQQTRLQYWSRIVLNIKHLWLRICPCHTHDTLRVSVCVCVCVCTRVEWAVLTTCAAHMASSPSRKGAEASMLALLSCSWRRSGSACMGCSSAHSASSAACEHAAHSRRSAPTTAAPIHSRNLPGARLVRVTYDYTQYLTCKGLGFTL